MKANKDCVIYYDRDCPMCRAYTSFFVHTGMLPPDGRFAYQDLEEGEERINRKRAVVEIAMLNRSTGEVSYGVDSLLHVLGGKAPWLKKLFSRKPLHQLASAAYAFVSYNRRVIVPVQNKPQIDFSKVDAPSIHRRWRLLYLLFAWLVTSILLHRYSYAMHPLVPAGGWWREVIFCGVQMLWQGVVVYLYKREKLWDYLGNLMTISLAGSLLLGSFQTIANAFSLANPTLFSLVFMAVAGLMMHEHLRRCRLLELPLVITVSWVLYRMFLLLFIF